MHSLSSCGDQPDVMNAVSTIFSNHLNIFVSVTLLFSKILENTLRIKIVELKKRNNSALNQPNPDTLTSCGGH